MAQSETEPEHFASVDLKQFCFKCVLSQTFISKEVKRPSPCVDDILCMLSVPTGMLAVVALTFVGFVDTFGLLM